MTHGSLFSGIGGFDLAAEMMGWQNIFHCEFDPFCQRVLKYHFPKSISYENIKTTDFTPHMGAVDILTGGFPCQPFSDAGLKGGTNDPRYLWPEMFRAVKEIRPRWVVAENVRGLISWNAGMVFDTVCADLESEGYEVWSFLLPACGVNAPHQRYRVWFVANATGERSKCRRSNCIRSSKNKTIGANLLIEINRFSGKRAIANAKSQQSERCELKQRESSWSEQGKFRRVYSQYNSRKTGYFDDFPHQHPISSGNDGLSSRLDGITLPKWRNESIKAYGNAIVPQVALQIFKAIEQFQKQL